MEYAVEELMRNKLIHDEKDGVQHKRAEETVSAKSVDIAQGK